MRPFSLACPMRPIPRKPCDRGAILPLLLILARLADQKIGHPGKAGADGEQCTGLAQDRFADIGHLCVEVDSFLSDAHDR